jgi:hypothetical protein
MSGFLCRCGEELSTIEAPNNVQLRIYTDEEWDSIINLGTIESINLPRPKYDVWRCPKCERIYFFDEGYGPPIKVYSLEE